MTKHATALSYLLILFALALVLVAGPTGARLTVVALLITTLTLYVALMGWRILRRRTHR